MLTKPFLRQGKTDEVFRQEVLDFMQGLERHGRFKLFKYYKDPNKPHKEWPRHTMTYVDRNAAYREVMNSVLVDVQCISVTWGEPHEFD